MLYTYRPLFNEYSSCALLGQSDEECNRGVSGSGDLGLAPQTSAFSKVVPLLVADSYPGIWRAARSLTLSRRYTNPASRANTFSHFEA